MYLSVIEKIILIIDKSQTQILHYSNSVLLLY